jgi:integrase
MAFVYRRKTSRFWWMCWTDANGIEQRASSKTAKEAEANALADELEAQARAGARREVLNVLTVQRFYDETWLPLRQRTRPWAWKADVAAMKRHFLPHFGSRAIAELATDDGEVALLDWLIALREHRSKRDGTAIAPRTVRNVASSIRVFFADAAERKVIRRNPTAGWNAERHMPPVEDKHRGWRERAGFSLEQVVQLTTDARIPEDRRALYALRFLGGLRPGEASNARWRDLDRARRPLWRLTLEAAFNSPMQREKSTKTGATLHVPIHPVLQRMLEDWWKEGWARFMGRAPQPDDLVFPREDGKHRLVSGTYKQFKQDLATLDLPAQRQYESRSTFRNLALSAGASEFHVNLITHPKPKRASDYYTRLEMQWPGMCDAVLAIDSGAWEGAPAGAPRGEVTVRVTSRVTAKGTTNEKPPASLRKPGVTLEREKGFEALRTVNKNPRRDARLPHKGSERLGKQLSTAVLGRACRIVARSGPTAT